jgi:hypothetical protein
VIRAFPVERGTQEHAASLYFSRASVHRAVRQLLHGLTGSRTKKLQKHDCRPVNGLPRG